MPQETASIDDADIHVTGSYEFIDCECRSVFRTLLIRGVRFVEIRRSHACASCRKRVTDHAERTGQHLLLEA
jgi:hypothetical protein